MMNKLPTSLSDLAIDLGNLKVELQQLTPEAIYQGVVGASSWSSHFSVGAKGGSLLSFPIRDLHGIKKERLKTTKARPRSGANKAWSPSTRFICSGPRASVASRDGATPLD